MNRTAGKGVTIITATIRPEHIHDIFYNYARQKWEAKELIIILNKDSLNMEDYLELAENYRAVRVFRLPESKSLGECLNFGVRKAKHSIIAKFDDDDYYGPHYIAEAMRAFWSSNADVVGKYSVHYYFPAKRKILLTNKSQRPHRFVRKIAGATIMFKKRVFPKAKFVRASLGTDVLFLAACRRHGYLIYTTTSYNFAAIRKPDSKSHTWQITERQMFAKRDSRVIAKSNYRAYVNRPVNRLQKP
ncbi:glycosyltransferase family 2 protein [Paenibacillus chartarius]|uniref:Glycosyltransferase family 2 protein n=1 Tax=Paenibacillus chartarius TaxID=747481 RepID=A0ABV6DH66_9BACL